MGHFYQPPIPFIGGLQPYQPRQLPAALLAVEIDPPPPNHAGRSPAAVGVVGAWTPPDPFPLEGGSQGASPRRLPASIIGSKVDNPPFQHAGRSAGNLAEVVGLAQPPDWPPVFAGGLQAFAPRWLAPSITAVEVDPPPVGAGPVGVSRRTTAVALWQPPDPSPYFGAAQGLAPNKLNPALTAVEVDNPPFAGTGRSPAVLATVVQAAQPPDWPYVFPASWQPYGRRSNAPIAAVRTDNPPVGWPRGLASNIVIRQAWEPPPPPVQPAPQLHPPVVTAPGLSIVGGFLETGPGGSGTYTIPNSHVVNIGRLAPCQVLITWLATGQAVGADWFSPSDFFVPTDFFGTNNTKFISAWAEIAISTDGTNYGAWVKYAPATYNLWAVKARMQIASGDPSTIAVLEAFKFTVDVPTRSDHYNISLAAGGSTITFAPDGGSAAAFNGGPIGQANPHLQVTIVGASAGDQVLVTGLSRSQVTIQVVNGGSGVARTVNVLAIGY
jgi:hypothetical protein